MTRCPCPCPTPPLVPCPKTVITTAPPSPWFGAGVAAVRRVLANVPTYMICDDHDVTDDWFMNRLWCRRVLDLGGNKLGGDTLGRRIVRNALIAYAVFQAWGNTPGQFDTTASSTLGGQLLTLLAAGKEMTDDLTTPANAGVAAGGVSALVGMPNPLADDAPALVRPGASLTWHYRWGPPGWPYEVIVLDCRTLRRYGKGLIEPPQLLDNGSASSGNPDQFAAQLGTTATSGVTLVVAQTPVLGVRWVEDTFQRSNRTKKVFDHDAEAWSLSAVGYELMLARLAAHNPNGVILLSGDVHYSFAASADYYGSAPWGGTGTLPVPRTARIVQLNSSSVRNETGLTRNFLHNTGYSALPMAAVETWVGFRARPAYTTAALRAYAGSLRNIISLAYKVNLPPIVLASEDYKALFGGSAAAPAPDWKYRIQFAGGTRDHPPAFGAPPDLATFPPDVVGELTAAGVSLASLVQQHQGDRGHADRRDEQRLRRDLHRAGPGQLARAAGGHVAARPARRHVRLPGSASDHPGVADDPVGRDQVRHPAAVRHGATGELTGMADFFEIIYARAEAVLEPVTQAAQSDWGLSQLLGTLGFDLDAVTGLDLTALETALNDLVDAIEALQSLSGPQAVSDIEAAAQAIASVIASVRTLLASLQQQAGLPAGLGAQLGAAGEQLLQALIARWVQDLHPAAYQVLNTLGVIDTAAQAGAPILASGGGVAYLPVPTTKVNTSTLLGLFRDPDRTLSKQVFGGPAPSGQAEVDALTAWLWPRLALLFGAVNRIALPGNDPGYRAATGDLGAAGDALANASLVFPIVSDDTGDQVLVALTLIPASAPGGKTVIALTVEGEATQTITAGPLQVTLSAAGALQALAVDTAGNVTLPSSAASGDSITLTAALSYAPPGTITDDPGSDDQVSPLLIGSANGTRIEVSQLTLTGTAAFAAATPATAGIELTVSGVNVVLNSLTATVSCRPWPARCSAARSARKRTSPSAGRTAAAST